MNVHRGSGSTGNILKIEPMKWYDFRVDTDYRGGGPIKFYVNGKKVRAGPRRRRRAGRFDCGIYWMHRREPDPHGLPQQRQHRRSRRGDALNQRSRYAGPA